MKISACFTVLLAISFILFAFLPSSGQTINSTRITLAIENETLKSALQKIQDYSGFNIFYSSANVNIEQKITLVAENRTVAETLNLLLNGTGLGYQQEGRSIIIAPNKTNVGPRRITGVVVGEDNLPLAGVTVRASKEPKNITATDVNGYFYANITTEPAILVFSSIGYQTNEIVLAPTQTELRTVLKTASGSLNEVQVIGYGTTTRRLNTGSVASITSEDLSRETVYNPMQALAGRISGLTIVQSNGNPGSNQTVQIRGVNNLTSNYGLSSSQPLIVIDGVPSTNLNGSFPLNDNLNIAISGANGGLSLFAGMNPQDVERIDVLKDADATAIYGSRGANGVILITTKRGKVGNAQLNVNFYQGMQSVGRFVEMLNTDQYLQLRNEAFKNDGVTPTSSNAPDLLTWDPNGYTNFQKLLIGGTAQTSDGQLTYSGGNERIQFFSSGNYHKEGSVYGADFGNTRIVGRLTLTTISANKKFKTTLSASYTDDNTDLPAVDVSNALSLPPNFPLYNPDGSLYWFGTTFTNPLASLRRQYSSGTQFFIASGNFDFNIWRGLHLKLNTGYTRNVLNQNSTNPIAAQNPSNPNTILQHSASFATSVGTNYIVEPQIDYTLQKGKSTFLGLIGSTFQKNLSTSQAVEATGYAFPALLTSLRGAGTITATPFNQLYQLYKYAAVFGKLNYDFDKKYLINITFRRDASSRFGVNQQFANFGAVGGAWIFSQENFVKDNVKVLSFGKLRASYGTTGNDQLPNYQGLSLYTSFGQYQGSSTLSLSGVSNPDLAWESTRKLEIGLDLGFFNDRLLLTANAYVHRSSNLLTYGILPTQSGFNSINTNLDAVVQNKGYEFTINSTNIQSKHFKWKSNFNISFQTTKMLSFNAKSTAFYGGVFLKGYPVPPSFYYKYVGVNPITGAAVIQDLNNSGNITVDDRYPAEIRNPYYGGLNNTIEYKQFTLSFFLQFNHRFGSINSIFGTRPGSLNNQNVSVLNRWRNPGDTHTLFPGASANPGGTGVIYSTYNNFGQSDFYYGDASWLKLRSASLSYSLPANISKQLKLSTARIYVQGQNLLTFAKNKYVLDPESGNSLPPLRTIVAGINFTFN